MEINGSKTKIMTNKPSELTTTINVNGDVIKSVDSFKYRMYTIGYHFRTNEDVLQQTENETGTRTTADHGKEEEATLVWTRGPISRTKQDCSGGKRRWRTEK